MTKLLHLKTLLVSEGFCGGGFGGGIEQPVFVIKLTNIKIKFSYKCHVHVKSSFCFTN